MRIYKPGNHKLPGYVLYARRGTIAANSRYDAVSNGYIAMYDFTCENIQYPRVFNQKVSRLLPQCCIYQLFKHKNRPFPMLLLIYYTANFY